MEIQLPFNPIPQKYFKTLDVENLETIDGIEMYTFLKSTLDLMQINPIGKKDSLISYPNLLVKDSNLESKRCVTVSYLMIL